MKLKHSPKQLERKNRILETQITHCFVRSSKDRIISFWMERLPSSKSVEAAILFGGVGKDYIDLLNNAENYFLILLTSSREGWFFAKAEINNNINSGKWRLREADNNYKINVPLPDTNSFITPSHFLKKIGIGQKPT